MTSPRLQHILIGAIEERRQSPRYKARAGVRLDLRRTCSNSEPNLATSLLNISAEGIGARLTVSVLPGDELQVTICRANGSSIVRLLGEVRWCRPMGGGLFAAGLLLSRRLTFAELAKLVG
jgi:hypothetical protein